jgi:hypothetical protein
MIFVFEIGRLVGTNSYEQLIKENTESGISSEQENLL